MHLNNHRSGETNYENVTSEGFTKTNAAQERHEMNVTINSIKESRIPAREEIC